MSDVESETKYEPFSTKRMMAFSLGGIILLTMTDIRGWVQLYMIWGLKLSIYMVLLVFLIYAMWDAVNDPLTGYLLDRSKKFTSRYGKRFPFIVIGFIGSLGMLVLLFLPITSNPVIAVIWILCFLVAWDQFQTIAELSLQALAADILRDNPQRAKLGSYFVLLGGFFAIVKGISIPISIAMFGGVRQPAAYFFTTMVVCLFLVILLIPHLISVREPQEMRELRTQLDQEGKGSSISFIEALKKTFRDKNWVTVVITYYAYAIMYLSYSIGMIIWIVDGLGLPIETMIYFSIISLALSFLSIPFWMKTTKKIGARKTYLYALIWIVILTPVYLIFGWNLISALIISGLISAGAVGVDVSFTAVYSEAIDNAAVQTGTREETSYLGVLRFFTATAIVWQIFIFMIVASITGYDPSIDYWSKSPDGPPLLIKVGLNMQVTVIPASILLIAVIIFYKFNDLTKEVAMENKKKLIDMGL